jgi:hypothetical protein
MASDEHDSVTRKDQPGHPENVGKSTTGKGEDVLKKKGQEAGRYDVEDKEAGRPVGKSTLRDVTGVDPKEPKS